MRAKLGLAGELKTKVTHPIRPRDAIAIRVPGGRIMWTRDRGEALLFSRERFAKKY